MEINSLAGSMTSVIRLEHRRLTSFYLKELLLNEFRFTEKSAHNPFILPFEILRSLFLVIVVADVKLRRRLEDKCSIRIVFSESDAAFDFIIR